MPHCVEIDLFVRVRVRECNERQESRSSREWIICGCQVAAIFMRDVTFIRITSHIAICRNHKAMHFDTDTCAIYVEGQHYKLLLTIETIFRTNRVI